MKMTSKSLLLAAFALGLMHSGCEQKVTNDGQARFEYFKYEGKDARFEADIDPNTQFLNPIIAGYYPDPSICRKDDTYYLVNSSFAYFPGVPIFTSKDMVNWTQIGHVLDRPSQLNLQNVGISSGIFAPAIEYNPANETFYMITTDVGGMGNFFVKTKDPLQGWSDPILLPEVKNIDPSFFFDEDGKAYIVHNDEPENGPDWTQQRTIRIHEFDVENDRTIGKSKEIVRGGAKPEEEPIWVEGPHLYKIYGSYYLMCAEGGTATDHSEVIFRSNSPWGPYEAAPYNPILTQRDLPNNRADMVACTGHADLIQNRDGEWWAVFLGTRPYDGDYMFNTGRETFMLPVEWENGFPIILKKGAPVPTVVDKKNLQPEENYLTGNFTYLQEFNDSTLDHSWIHIRTPQQDFYSVENGQLTINPLPVSIEEQKSPAAVLRRQQHAAFALETQLTYIPETENDFAGLTLFQNERHQILFGKTIIDGKVNLVVYRLDKNKELLASLPLEGRQANASVNLKVEGEGRSYNFFYSLQENEWLPLMEDVDASNLSTQVAGGFVGTTIGLYATSNHTMAGLESAN
jgi:alpha-N-arabinofuranosidase